MYFKLLFIVLVLSVAEIGSHPVQNGVESVDDAVFGKIFKKFKIPQEIKPHNFTITINGTALGDVNSVVSILLADDNNMDTCSIVLDIKHNYIKVSPPMDEDTLILSLLDPPEFSIKVSARLSVNGKKLFAVTLTGENEVVDCKIRNFNNISYIIVKDGVRNIQNMLFEFITKTETS